MKYCEITSLQVNWVYLFDLKLFKLQFTSPKYSLTCKTTVSLNPFHDFRDTEGRFARAKQKSLLIFQVQILCCHAHSIRCYTSFDWIQTDSQYKLSWVWSDKYFYWIQSDSLYNLSEGHAIKTGRLVACTIKKRKYIFDVSTFVAKLYTLKIFTPKLIENIS